jgi:membrane-associated phospholipid phosphatase
MLLLRHRVPGWTAFLWVHMIYLAVVFLLIVKARCLPTAHAWYPLAMPLVTFGMIAQLNFLFVDTWQDRFLLAFESWLFPQPPTVWLAHFASPFFTEILELGYLSYFVMLATVAGVLYRRADKAPFAGVMAASVLSYMLCSVVFVAFPTEGPAHTLRHLHTVPLTGGIFHWLVKLTQHGGVHGNAFPSTHVAGGVVPLIFAWRYVPDLATWLALLVTLLCIGAVYDRYHYASDIFAGILVGAGAACFVMFVQARPQWAMRLNANSI